MSQFFPKPNKRYGRNVKVELDIYNYATKSDLKNAAGVDTSNFYKRIEFCSLKLVVDKLDIDKLVDVPIGLTLIWVGEEDIPLPPAGFPLITKKRYKL